MVQGMTGRWWEGEGAQSPEYSLCLIVLCLPSLSNGGLAWDSTSTGRGKRMPGIPQGAGAWYWLVLVTASINTSSQCNKKLTKRKKEKKNVMFAVLERE